MIKYIVIHNKHEGCYDFQCYQDEVARIRLTSITINPPKIFMFSTREEAQDFFEEYINDVDCIDIKCRRGDEVEHVDYCTCGIIELDNDGEPILFYNKRNQIFLMENAPQMFLPNQELKNDVRNLNLTNKLIRKCKTLGREQRKRYIELGKYCEECNADEPSDNEEEKSEVDNIVIKEKVDTIPETPVEQIKPDLQPEPVKKKRVMKKSTAKEMTNETIELGKYCEECNADEPTTKKKTPRKPKQNK